MALLWCSVQADVLCLVWVMAVAGICAHFSLWQLVLPQSLAYTILLHSLHPHKRTRIRLPMTSSRQLQMGSLLGLD